jgi:hypothetical protein
MRAAEIRALADDMTDTEPKAICSGRAGKALRVIRQAANQSTTATAKTAAPINAPITNRRMASSMVMRAN